MTVGRALPRAAALLTSVILLVASPAGGVAAQQEEGPSAPRGEAQVGQQADEPDVRLVVSSLTGVVGPGINPPADGEEPVPANLDLRVLVENQGRSEIDGLQLVVEVHRSVGGARSLLRQALDRGVLPATFEAVERVDVRDGEALSANDIAGERIRIDGQEIGWAGTNDVYPVRISVLSGAEVLDQVVTAAVHLVDPPDIPLQATVVWPLSAPSDRTAEGTHLEALPDHLAPGGRLDVLLTALERHVTAPIMVAPEPAMLEDLADRADGFVLADGTVVPDDDPAAVAAASLLDRIRAVVEATPLAPVVGPYADADVAALATAPPDVNDLAAVAVDSAITRTQALLGRAPGDAYLSTTPLTPAAIGLIDAGHLLLPYGQVEGPSLSGDPDLPAARQRVPRSGDDQRIALVADPYIAEILVDPPVDAGLAVARQRLVAETALIHLTRPGEAGRALLVLPPITWEPARGTAQGLLDALTTSPWLHLTDPASATPGTATLANELTTSSAVLPALVAAELSGVRQRLAALRVAMPGGVSLATDQQAPDLDDALLRAVTPVRLAGGGSEALGRIRAVGAVIERAFGEVALVDGARVTLTSDSGDVPVTLQRTSGGDIDLVVEIESAGRLQWDDGAQTRPVTLPAESSRTVAFTTQAVSRGTFPVTVTVWDPTHTVLLDSATMSVRSTSISRPALAVIGVIVVGLLLVGARRRRSPRLEVVR